jgi:hypothetical protein
VNVLRTFADDFCIGIGLCLVGVGVYQVWPVATWFYAGAALVGVGVLVARGVK